MRLEPSVFDTILGLPLHPLVVHLAVVLLPLSTLALLAIIAVPRWRRPYGWLTLAGLVVGGGGAVLAAQTGEALAEHVGLPADHARWGEWTERSAVVLVLVAAVWFWLQRRSAARPGALGGAAQAVATWASVLLAVVTLGLTVAVGHSGATAVWAGRLDAGASSTPSASSGPGASSSPSASSGLGASSTPSTSASGYTMADVQAHNTASDCWAAVDGSVYDLTSWISRHPGGPGVIKALCGTDASTAFHNQHGSQRQPNDVLAGFKIGTLAAG